MGGKRQANILSSVIQNFKTVEDVIESSSNASGSALTENEKYLDSIQGRIDQFNNALQTMWMNFINDEVVKFIVDIGTGLIKLADTVGPLESLVFVFTSLQSAISNIKTDFEDINTDPSKSFNIFGDGENEGIFESFTNKIKEFIKARQEANDIVDESNNIQKSSTDSIENAIQTQQEQTKITDRNSSSTEQNTQTHRRRRQAQQQDAQATFGSTSATQRDTQATAANTIAKKANVAVTKILVGLKNIAKGIVIGAAITAITKLVTSFIEAKAKEIERVKELTDKALKSADEVDESRKKIDDYKDSIDELRGKLDSNNLSEADAYDIRKKLIEIQDELIKRFGKEAKGIDLVTGAIDAQKAALDALAQQEADDWLKNNAEAYEAAKDAMEQTHDYSNEGWGPIGWAKDVFSGKDFTVLGKKGKNEQDTWIDGSEEVTKAFRSGLRDLSKDMQFEMDRYYGVNVIDGFYDNINVSFEGKTLDEIEQILDAISQYLLDFEAEYGVDLGSERANIEEIMKRYITDDYKQQRELYKEGRIQEANSSKYASQTREILNAQDQYYQASSDEDRLAAIQNMRTAIQQAKDKYSNDEYMDEYFDELGKQFNAAEFELKVKLDEDALKSDLEKTIEESGLSTLDDNQIKDMVDKGLNQQGATSDIYSQEQIKGLQELQAQADSAGISIDDLISILTKLGLIMGRPQEVIQIEEINESIKTYSKLLETITKLNEAEQTSKELFADNMKTTEEYYNSLVELDIATDDLAECIDKDNGYIVTNAEKLKELLKVQKDTVTWNVKLAKSQAELQYNDAIQSLHDALYDFNKVNIDIAETLFEQADALRNTINQYQLLENSLLGATNAFTQFSKAQETDSKNTYGSTLVEMAQTMYDAIYKTGEVGSEAFWAAVKATVPDDIYMGLAPGEQQIKAIQNYLQNNLFSGLTFSGDSFSIDYSSIESFVKKAQSKGLFWGTDAKSFGISPTFMGDLEDFANEMGVTKEYVYAMLSEMDKYNANGMGLSMLFELDDSASSQLTIINTQLEQAFATRKKLIKQGKDLSANDAQINYLTSQQAGMKAKITADTSKYLTIADVLSMKGREITDLISEGVLSSELVAEMGIEIPEDTVVNVEDVVNEISDYLLQLEEPTTLELEISKDSIQEDMDEIKKSFGNGFETKLKIFKGEEVGELTQDEKNKLEEYSRLYDMDQLIDTAMSKNLTKTETLLSEIATNTGIMAGTKEAPKEKSETQTESATTSDNNGAGLTTEGQQNQKPKINSEDVQYNMPVDKAINDLMIDLANKRAELSNSPNYFGLENDLENIEKLQDQILAIRKEFDNPDSIIPIADLMAQWSEIATKASKFGIEVPLTIKVNEDALSFDGNETIDTFTYNGNVDLNSRQLVPFDEKHFKAWADYYRDVIKNANEYSAEYVAGVKEDLASIERGDSTATVYSQTYYKSDFAENGELAPGEGNYAIVLTPILPDGTVISPEALDAYAERIFNGEEIEPQITLGIFDGENFEEDAAQFADNLHESQAELYGLSETAQETQDSLGRLFTVSVPDSEAIKILQDLTDKERQQTLHKDDAAILGFSIDTTYQQALDAIIERSKMATNSLYNFKQAAISTYSALQTQVSSYNDLQTQTAEIMTSGTEVTQDYVNSLSALIEDQTALNDCFEYSGDKIIVKNIDALEKLIKTAKKNTAANVKLAKSQTQLKYYKLVKELGQAAKGMDGLNDASGDTTKSIKDQIKEVKQAIYQYQLLEDNLLGTTNAFANYKKAQDIDALNTYGDDYVSMVQTMYDALYKTGEVGTEQFWAAVDATVPTSKLEKAASDAERMKIIYDYLNKEILPSLTVKDGEISMNFKNIEKFVKQGIKAGVFTGNTKEFDLVEGLNLDEAAKKLGMTTTQAYTFFALLDKYNVARPEQSFLSRLDDSTSGTIMKLTTQMEELNDKKIALLKDDGYEKNKKQIDEINKQLAENDAKLKELGETAYTTWQAYTKTDAALAVLKQVEDKTSTLSAEDAIQLGIEWADGMTVQDVINQLEEQLANLEATDALTAQLSIDYINIQLSGLQTALDRVTNGGALNDDEKVSLGLKIDATPEELKAEINTKIQALKEEKAGLAVTFGIELTEEEKTSLQEELNAIEEFKINDKEFKVTVTGTSTVMLQLRNVKRWLDGLKSKNITVTTIVRQTTNSNPPSGGDVDAVSGAGVNGTAHAQGTAHKSGSWGAPKTETSLVGELGPELLVRGNRWTTVGENGAEFTDIRKGDIIFNHKQTEDLLSKGYITGRGKAYAEGTAYAGLWTPTGSSSGSGSGKDDEDGFKEIFDWIAVRIEEITEVIELTSARIENAIGVKNKNSLIDEAIKANQKLYDNLTAGAATYYKYSEQLLAKIPAQYRAAAQDGTIAIEEFFGEVGEETYNAINDYREWVQKGADATQQAEEALTEISTLAKQAIDNISAEFENRASLGNNAISQLEAYNALLETTQGFEAAGIYQEMIKENNKNIQILKQQRNQMQAELNKRVEAGEIKKYSQDWYDAVNSIAEVDTEIINLTTDTNEYQDSVNELHWDQFDALINRLDAISNESNNLIDILGNKDLVDEDTAEWTDEGITSLGLYAQQLEVAEMQAKKYREEIAYLNKNWKKLGYTEQEYAEKLEELKENQYDAIKSYHDTKDAIVDLTSTRVDAIKDGIQKEIDAYEELIEKKKEELSSEKDLYDFQKSIKESEKDIADIQRKLAALSSDNSAQARAERARLQAQLAEKQQELEEKYYDRSVSDQQEALDKELENFQETKDKEIEKWEEYLEDTEKVVADALAVIQSNTDVVYNTLSEMGKEYSLSIADSIVSPWQDGESAIQSYSEKFGLSMSSTVEQLKELETTFKQTIAEIEKSSIEAVNTVQSNIASYQAAVNQTPARPSQPAGDVIVSGGGSSGGGGSSYPYGRASDTSGNIKRGAKGDDVRAIQYALNQLGYGNSGTTSLDGNFGSGTESAVKSFQRAMGIKVDGIVGTNTRAKFRANGYASGTTGTKKNELAWIDEMGLEELVMHAGPNGRLQYLSKGTSVVPADLTSNLMEWGALDPQNMLDQNRPVISSPRITNNNIELNMNIDSVVHVDTVTQDTIPDLTKTINKELDKYMKGLNSQIRKYVR